MSTRNRHAPWFHEGRYEAECEAVSPSSAGMYAVGLEHSVMAAAHFGAPAGELYAKAARLSFEAAEKLHAYEKWLMRHRIV